MIKSSTRRAISGSRAIRFFPLLTMPANESRSVECCDCQEKFTPQNQAVSDASIRAKERYAAVPGLDAPESCSMKAWNG
ncbi:hypothetical protein, partial [Cronobacter sakazakii]|uniref:hypothetical protein n=1 Tax=Cronobacter sakazakii TaxID=28141 RepID=UPI001FB32ADE